MKFGNSKCNRKYKSNLRCIYIYQLEDIENAAYLVATCTIMIDVFFFQLRDVKLAYCNKNEGHANCSISCTG